jgi:hypothetical protein
MQNAVRFFWRCDPAHGGTVFETLKRKRRYSSLSRENGVERLKVVCGSAGSIDVE